ALIARHASLRARIVSEGVGPRQRFDVGFEAIYSRENLDDRAPGSLADRLAEQAYQPFPLAEGPLFRLALLRTADSHILLVSAHQDRKSTRLNSSHVSTSYRVFRFKKKRYRI